MKSTLTGNFNVRMCTRTSLLKVDFGYFGSQATAVFPMPGLNPKVQNFERIVRKLLGEWKSSIHGIQVGGSLRLMNGIVHGAVVLKSASTTDLSALWYLHE